ncbi:MAG: response regulator [Clostridiales bacterium]|nr:response regulator [Clostridiales bacterium]
MGKVKVMIVDDSPFQIALLKEALEENGFEVVGEAKSLEEVTSQVAKVKPDIVTMDMTIPGTDGFECSKAIFNIDDKIKIVFVSSMMDDELIRRAKKEGISGYIQKPVDSEDLALLINRVMDDESNYDELKGLYPGIFREAILNVYNKLLKIVPEIINENYDNGLIESQGVSIVMGITGKYSGRVLLDMSNETAEKLAEALLNKKITDEEQILNVITEIANMYAGNACSMVNKKNKIFGLRVAPPTTFYGESINVCNAELENMYTTKVKTQYGELLINVGFRRGEKQWMQII